MRCCIQNLVAFQRCVIEYHWDKVDRQLSHPNSHTVTHASTTSSPTRPFLGRAAPFCRPLHFYFYFTHTYQPTEYWPRVLWPPRRSKAGLGRNAVVLIFPPHVHLSVFAH